MIFRLIIFMLSATLSSVAHANTDWIKLESDLTRLVRSPSFIEKQLDVYELKGMPRRVLREHYIEIYKTDEVIKYLVGEMKNLNLDSLKVANYEEYGRKFGTELVTTLSLRGLARLSNEEQRDFIGFTKEFMAASTPADCKAMIAPEGIQDPMQEIKLGLKYYAAFTEDRLRTYHRIMRKAMFAEIRGRPSTKKPSQTQVELAMEVFVTEVQKEYATGKYHPDSLSSIQNLTAASPQVACSGGILIFESVLRMRGYVGEVMVAEMIQSMQ